MSSRPPRANSLVCHAALLFTLVCWPITATAAAPPPTVSISYKGQSITYWRSYLRNEEWSPHFYWPPRNHPLRTPDPKALPLLSHLAVDRDDGVRWSAITLIGRYRDNYEIVVPVLIQALDDQKEAIRIKALLAIKGLGRKGANAAATIRKIMSNVDQEMQELADETLRAIQPR